MKQINSVFYDQLYNYDSVFGFTQELTCASINETPEKAKLKGGHLRFLQFKKIKKLEKN